MFDKEYTIHLVNQVIKNEIIPSLNNGMAREQAIAMISVLKNVNANTRQNLDPYKEVIDLFVKELDVLFERVSQDNSLQDTNLNRKVKEFQNQLNSIKANQEIKETWEELNGLTSKFITCLYEDHSRTSGYISAVRKLMRKQLNIEMALVS
ncbi:hypothetical protein DCC39_13125 [Pueribacillus theae]|uniref:Uncharacterized protein n=1 Tax=Pueribacillus theae TaxID=2171751 RepID=A0A2U1JWR6_9BACI|nr:hypothetical protein [Pueribacillus theae]PWA09435.1 hypothetical protein DCC39_13125 [Pueribacillus theae]